LKMLNGRCMEVEARRRAGTEEERNMKEGEGRGGRGEDN
jgi:hypothetical protein